ncbi:MAG: ArsS family sensor histidine kinase [Sulfurimonadaceae bacterium]|nr:ArsS family sensor histidine kinase [Sulfurimonadaceae bacterium]
MMYKRHAVLLTILAALVITLVSVSYTFWEFYQHNRIQYINNIFTKYSVITRLIREHRQSRSPIAILEANLAVYDLDLLKDEDEAKHIVERAKVLKREGFQAVNEELFFNRDGVYSQKMVQDMRASMLQMNNEIYFLIESRESGVLLKDNKLTPYREWNLLYAYIVIVSMIVITFILILQRIRPLRLLQRRIAAFGAGDMNVSFAMRGEDEIALVANELEDTRKKIQALMESRTLFLRNIMHELKTPIAKGRIASQMLDSDKQRTRFNKIFERMEFLINEFALIEEVTAGSEHLEMTEYRLLDLIDGAVDLAMVESESVEVLIDSSYKLTADYRLFATAIKNMIDNALKYSPEQKVTIGTDGREIWFDNSGEPLSRPLAYYVEPFTKDHPSKNSFGLGLYLVDSILKTHGMVLAYEHRDGINRFIFVPEK